VAKPFRFQRSVPRLRGWSRRAVLALAPAGLGAAVAPALLQGGTETSPGAPVGFRLASQSLTGEAVLEPVLVERYWAAFAETSPGLLTALRRLSQVALENAEVGALMAAARAQGLETAAQALTTAWFTGTVGSGPRARTVAYADALMYGTVADGLAPPTYVLGGPAWWTAAPPPAHAPAPTSQPVRPGPVPGPPVQPRAVPPPGAPR
jgi:hypothetical protein